MDDSPWRCVYHPWGLCFGAKPPVLSNVGVNHQTILHHLLPVSHGPTPASPQQRVRVSTFCPPFSTFCPPFSTFGPHFPLFAPPPFSPLFCVQCHLTGSQQGWAVAKQTIATDKLTNRWPESCHCLALDPQQKSNSQVRSWAHLRHNHNCHKSLHCFPGL